MGEKSITSKHDGKEKAMITYNICFIRRENQILLLNRQKSSWMGAWNGVGGKIEQGESPVESVRREVLEETGLSILPDQFEYKGLVTWLVDDYHLGGMHLYKAWLEPSVSYETPLKTSEGILDWKEISWILHPENMGVAANIPDFLPYLLEEEGCFIHHCIFKGHQLVKVHSTPVSSEIETDKHLLEQELLDVAGVCGQRGG